MRHRVAQVVLRYVGLLINTIMILYGFLKRMDRVLIALISQHGSKISHWEYISQVIVENKQRVKTHQEENWMPVSHCKLEIYCIY